MDLKGKVDPHQDVTSLMNPLEETEWHKEGLIIQADSAEVISSFPPRLSCKFPLVTGIHTPTLPSASGSFRNLPYLFHILLEKIPWLFLVFNNLLLFLLSFFLVEVTKWKLQLADLGALRST
jgi:hypothetical protein